MITVKRQDALKWIKEGRLPAHLEGKVTVVMSRRHAKKWLTKLEDGTQRQASNILYNKYTKGFCCLGLEQACNWRGRVEAEATGDSRPLPTSKYLRATGKMYFSRHGRGGINPSLGDTDAATLNDEGYTFKAIAALLRKQMAVYD